MYALVRGIRTRVRVHPPYAGQQPAMGAARGRAQDHLVQPRGESVLQRKARCGFPCLL